MIELYSRRDCRFCEAAKKILEWKNLEFKEYLIGEDISRDDAKLKFPNSSLLPIVVIDGNIVGGYNDLLNYLSQLETKGTKND